MEAILVYHPGDEPLLFTYGAQDLALPPNAFVVLNGLDAPPSTTTFPTDLKLPGYCTVSSLAKDTPAGVALRAHLLATQGARGVVAVDDQTPKGLQEAFDHGEARHTEWLRSTLTPILARANAAKKAAEAAGIKHQVSDEALKATLQAKEWGLLAEGAGS